MKKSLEELKIEIASVEAKWNEAIVSNNVNEVAKYMTDDWVITGTEGGIQTKTAFLEWLRSGDLVHTEMSFEAQLVQVHGDTAVVTAKGTSAGTWQGHPFSFYEWATSTYIRQGGRWVCINTMITPANAG